VSRLYFLRVCLTCATLHMLKQLIVVTFSWKTTIIYSKVLYLIILNVQVSIQNFYFKLLNMCKFAHHRKTHFLMMSISLILGDFSVLSIIQDATCVHNNSSL